MTFAPCIAPYRFGYVSGLQGEAQRHAAYHARYLPRRPKPEPRLEAFGWLVRDGDLTAEDAKEPLFALIMDEMGVPVRFSAR